jgi:hypothetical protein
MGMGEGGCRHARLDGAEPRHHTGSVKAQTFQFGTGITTW